jgi:hypothetical protein
VFGSVKGSVTVCVSRSVKVARVRVKVAEVARRSSTVAIEPIENRAKVRSEYFRYGYGENSFLFETQTTL